MVEHDSGTATPRPSGLDRGAFRFHRPSWKRYRTVTKVGAGGAVLDPFLSVVGDVMVRMNDAGVWELEQQFMAAAWDSARAATAAGPDSVTGFLEALAQAEAHLAGLRLAVLDQARFMPEATKVLDAVTSSTRHTPTQAKATIRLAADLSERFRLILDALQAGLISDAQAEAITDGLRRLPARLSPAELELCQREILTWVDELGPSELRTLAARLTEVIDPDRADADDAKRLAREDRAAHGNRFLRLSPDHHGSMRITGQLPVADAALLTAQLDALMPPASAYAHTGEAPSRDARRADALVLLTQHAAGGGTLPSHGVDRPQIHLTLDYDTLITGVGSVSVLGTGSVDGLSASEARRMACDAGLIPMVLGTASRPLDVGRTHRLFTPALRAALLQRDQGCVFPGCTAAPAACEAHHFVPWWQGGATCLANGVLLCPFHHRLVEPDPLQSEESQWRVHLDQATGLPWFTPPRHIDPARRPRQHQRHRLQQLNLQPGAPPCPHEASDPPGWDPLDPDTRSARDTYAEHSLDELIEGSAAIWGSHSP